MIVNLHAAMSVGEMPDFGRPSGQGDSNLGHP